MIYDDIDSTRISDQHAPPTNTMSCNNYITMGLIQLGFLIINVSEISVINVNKSYIDQSTVLYL
jgi:hypothetical protein